MLYPAPQKSPHQPSSGDPHVLPLFMLPVSSNIVSDWFVHCQGEAANTRPLDSVGGASLNDAARLRFNIIREQTIPCTTRVITERNLLRGDYIGRGVISQRPEGCRFPFTGSKRERIGNSDETECGV